MPARIAIRSLTERDAEAYRRLRLEALETDPRAFSASAEEHQAISLEEIAQRIAGGPNQFVLGAFDGKSLVGTAGFYRESGSKRAHRGNVWGMYATPSYRGRGIARDLMHELLDRARAINGVESVALGVAVSQKEAISLYRSLGFISWGREPNCYRVAGEPIEVEWMTLRL